MELVFGRWTQDGILLSGYRKGNALIIFGPSLLNSITEQFGWLFLPNLGEYLESLECHGIQILEALARDKSEEHQALLTHRKSGALEGRAGGHGRSKAQRKKGKRRRSVSSLESSWTLTAKAVVTGRHMNTRTIHPKLTQYSQCCESTTLQFKKANQEADGSNGIDGGGGVARGGRTERRWRQEAGGRELRHTKATICISYHRYQPHSFHKSKTQVIHQSLEVLARAVSEPGFSLCVKWGQYGNSMPFTGWVWRFKVIPSTELWMSKAGAQSMVPTISQLSAPSLSPSKLWSPPCPS